MLISSFISQFESSTQQEGDNLKLCIDSLDTEQALTFASYVAFCVHSHLAAIQSPATVSGTIYWAGPTFAFRAALIQQAAANISVGLY